MGLGVGAITGGGGGIVVAIEAAKINSIIGSRQIDKSNLIKYGKLKKGGLHVSFCDSID